MFQILCLFIGDEPACEMGFVKLNPTLPRAEPDPWLALLTAWFPWEISSWFRGAQDMEEGSEDARGDAGDTWPWFPPPQVEFFGVGLTGQGRA